MQDEITSPPSSTPISVESPQPRPVTILDALGAARDFIKGPEGENDHPLSPNASPNPVVNEFQSATNPIPTPDSPVTNTVSSPPESPWSTPAPAVEPTITTIANTSPGSQETFGQSYDTNPPIIPAASEHTVTSDNQSSPVIEFAAPTSDGSETHTTTSPGLPPEITVTANNPEPTIDSATEAQDAPKTIEETNPWTEEDANEFRNKLVEVGLISESSPTPHVIPEDSLSIDELSIFLRNRGVSQSYFGALSGLPENERHYRMDKLYRGAFNEETRRNFETTLRAAKSDAQSK